MKERTKVVSKFLIRVKEILIKIFSSFLMVIGILLTILLNYFFFIIWNGLSFFPW
jgi:hypothetical protein